MTSALKAVWLDRDGTINVKAPDGEYVTHPGELRLMPGAGAAVARLNRAGVRVAVVTNQRGIALGRMSEGDLDAVHGRLTELLAGHRAHLDLILHCPHGKDACDCRKPAPGLIYRAASLLAIEEMAETVMIGDSETDVVAGRSAGSRTIRIAEGGVATQADVSRPSLAEAVDLLLSGPARRRPMPGAGPPTTTT